MPDPIPQQNLDVHIHTDVATNHINLFAQQSASPAAPPWDRDTGKMKDGHNKTDMLVTDRVGAAMLLHDYPPQLTDRVAASLSARAYDRLVEIRDRVGPLTDEALNTFAAQTEAAAGAALELLHDIAGPADSQRLGRLLDLPPLIVPVGELNLAPYTALADGGDRAVGSCDPTIRVGDYIATSDPLNAAVTAFHERLEADNRVMIDANADNQLQMVRGGLAVQDEDGVMSGMLLNDAVVMASEVGFLRRLVQQGPNEGLGAMVAADYERIAGRLGTPNALMLGHHHDEVIDAVLQYSSFQGRVQALSPLIDAPKGIDIDPEIPTRLLGLTLAQVAGLPDAEEPLNGNLYSLAQQAEAAGLRRLNHGRVFAATPDGMHYLLERQLPATFESLMEARPDDTPAQKLDLLQRVVRDRDELFEHRVEETCQHVVADMSASEREAVLKNVSTLGAIRQICEILEGGFGDEVVRQAMKILEGYPVHDRSFLETFKIDPKSLINGEPRRIEWTEFIAKCVEIADTVIDNKAQTTTSAGARVALEAVKYLTTEPWLARAQLRWLGVRTLNYGPEAEIARAVEAHFGYVFALATFHHPQVDETFNRMEQSISASGNVDQAGIRMVNDAQLEFSDMYQLTRFYDSARDHNIVQQAANWIIYTTMASHVGQYLPHSRQFQWQLWGLLRSYNLSDTFARRMVADAIAQGERYKLQLIDQYLSPGAK